MPTRIVVEAEIRYTENRDKVIKAIKNLVDISSFTTIPSPRGEKAIGESSSLEALLPLHQAIRVEKILDTVRSVLKKNKREDSTHLLFHKQAAFVGKVSIVDSDRESPLGAIKLLIVRDNIDEVIDWLAPPTSRGKPLWEKPMLSP
ncbi:MAG: RNA-binding domain-containing protein [Acidilobaceae archaeon]